MEANNVSIRWILTSLCVLVYFLSGIPTTHPVSDGNSNGLDKTGTDDHTDFQQTDIGSAIDASQSVAVSSLQYMNSSFNGTGASSNVSRLLYRGSSQNGIKCFV